MEPVRGPVGSDIASVTPYGAYLHTAERLPNVLTTADVTIGNHDGAIGVDDTGGEGLQN
jgi:hypothetical protein